MIRRSDLLNLFAYLHRLFCVLCSVVLLRSGTGSGREKLRRCGGRPDLLLHSFNLLSNSHVQINSRSNQLTGCNVSPRRRRGRGLHVHGHRRAQTKRNLYAEEAPTTTRGIIHSFPYTYKYRKYKLQIQLTSSLLI